MYSYALLEPGCYYLVQETEESGVTIIKVNVESDHCVFITRYLDAPELEWKKKNDTLFDIIECLTDEKVREWESVYKDNQESYYEEDDE